MKIFRKILWIILAAILLIITVFNLLAAVGTLYDGIPIFSTIGNVFTVGMSHKWLIFALVITCILLALSFIRKKNLYRVLCVLSALSLGCGIFIIYTAAAAVNEQGGNADFFKSFQQTEYDAVIKDTIQYESTISDDSYMDIYYEDDGITDKPVVLYIHGGGWIGGDRNENSYYMQQFADCGYIAVSADYDLSSETEHRVDTAEEQLTYAVGWIEEHISLYGGSTDRFYIIGDSAGGNFALEIAYKINGGIYTKAGTAELPKVTAVSVLYPVIEMSSVYHNSDPLLSPIAENMVFSYMGTDPEKDPELYASVSPVNYVSENAPATCISAGEKDRVVDPSQSTELIEKLNEAGVDSRLVSVPYANHLYDMGGTNFGGQAYMNITLEWFDTHK